HFEEKISVVDKTLKKKCDGADKPMIMVFNKIDAFTHVEKDENDLTPRMRENIPLEELRQMWMARLPHDCVFISAKTGKNIDELKQMLYERAKEIHLTRFPYNDFLFQKYDEE
ncbi:MAG: GTPase HflX, partial [Duncaniella sp.]|nr:GTPase HflX [Duncaniella sp.]